MIKFNGYVGEGSLGTTWVALFEHVNPKKEFFTILFSRKVTLCSYCLLDPRSIETPYLCCPHVLQIRLS